MTYFLIYLLLTLGTYIWLGLKYKQNTYLEEGEEISLRIAESVFWPISWWWYGFMRKK